MRVTSRLGVLVVIIVFIGVVAAAPGVAGQETATAQANVSDVTVQPGGSIQNAIDNADSGETVEIQSGTYEQSVTVDKPLTLTGTGDVVLDGDTLSDEAVGIKATSSDVTIENMEIRRFSDSGIAVSGGNALTRTVVVRNVTSRLNDGNGLYVEATEDASTVTITDSRFADNGLANVFGSGDFDTVQITDTETTGSAEDGVTFTTTTATLRNVQANNNGEDDFGDSPFEGIQISGAEDVTLENIIARDNYQDNILISGEPLTRTVKATNVTVQRSETRDGFVIESATENDEINATDITAVDNDNAGIDFSASSVSLSQATSRENSEDGISISSTSATLHNVQTNDNGEDDFGDSPYEGVQVSGAEDVTLENIIARDNYQDNILISGEPLTRTVEATNVTVQRSETGDGFVIESATENDEINATDITAVDNDNAGIDFSASSVSLSQATSQENTLDGIFVSSTSVTLRNVRANNNGADADLFGDNEYQGIEIDSAEDVSLTDVTAKNNYETNVLIDGEPLTRTVEITNATLKGSETDSGLGITASTEGNEVTVTNLTATGNDADGIFLAAATAEVTRSTLSGNGDAGIDFTAVSGSASISQSSLINNEDAAVENQADGVTVDATGNWWGDPAGPGTEAIIGNVDTSDPLGSAPGASLLFNPRSVALTPDSQRTLTLSAAGTGDGVAVYEFNLSVTNTSVAEIDSISPTRSPEISEDIQVAADGSTAAVSVVLGTNAYDVADPSLVEVTVVGVEEGSASVQVTTPTVAASSGEYTIESTSPANITTQTTTEPSVSDYTNSAGIVETSGLITAIGDWRSNDIDVGLLLDTIAAWRSGTPVN
jgi:hypothetical protein